MIWAVLGSLMYAYCTRARASACSATLARLSIGSCATESMSVPQGEEPTRTSNDARASAWLRTRSLCEAFTQLAQGLNDTIRAQFNKCNEPESAGLSSTTCPHVQLSPGR